ncbi:MAG: hypothetical protein RLZZ223_133 [Candidatus Parcubacteria bacterium]|jgi:predicted PurR-regulated permease PerM
MQNKINQINLAISKESVLRLVLFILLIAFSIYLRYLIVTIVIAFILASFAKYSSNLLNKRYNISHSQGLTLVFVALSVLLISSVSLLFPLVVKESYGLFQVLSTFVKNVELWFYAMGMPVNSSLIQQFSTIVPNIGEVVINLVGIFGQLLTYIILILVLSFYIAVDKTGVNTIVKIFVASNIKDDVPNIVKRLEHHIGKWAFMEAVIAFIIGMFTYVTLSILGLQYAALLSILAGLAQLIPLIGPALIILIIVIYSFVQSPVLGFIVILLITFIQFIKQFLVLPVLFNTSKPYNTLLVVLALMIGGVLAGALGVIIAMPVVSLSSIIYKDIMSYD